MKIRTKKSEQLRRRTSSDNDGENAVVYEDNNNGKDFNIRHLLVQFRCRQLGMQSRHPV